MKRFLRYPLEAAFAWLLAVLLGLLPLDAASALGGRLARLIGPRVKAHRVARRNVERALPELSAAEVERVLDGMWDNLGRVAAEYAHLAKLRAEPGNPRVQLEGMEHVAAVRASGKPAIFFSAHFGNWEMMTYAATSHGLPLTRIYRAPNNPWVDSLLRRLRRPVGGMDLPKGAQGARGLIAALRAGRSLALLSDQKMNDGISVPFFGREAMTAPALAQLALRFGCPVIPAHCIRTDGAHFRLIVEPPVALPDSGDTHADIAATMRTVNAKIETWIREHPEQWLWVHKRWPD